MKSIVITLLLSLFPVILMGQLKSDLKTFDKESELIEVNSSSIITPVLERDNNSYEFKNSWERRFTEKPGLAFLSSAILPGSGRAANENWFLAGTYMAIEAASIYFIVDYRNRGITGEQSYENFADQNWSVVQYADWIVQYHDMHNFNVNCANNCVEQLRDMVDGHQPAFDTDIDWNVININLLREVERNTPYLTTDFEATNNFSHTLPAYGSQQYYELIAKYYQYQSGWADYYPQSPDPFFVDLRGGTASPLFFDAARRAQQFNDDYRTSRNILALLFVNHIISAFDSYFTFTLKQNRLETTPSVMPGQQLQFRYHF